MFVSRSSSASLVCRPCVLPKVSSRSASERMPSKVAFASACAPLAVSLVAVTTMNGVDPSPGTADTPPRTPGIPCCCRICDERVATWLVFANRAYIAARCTVTEFAVMVSPTDSESPATTTPVACAVYTVGRVIA